MLILRKMILLESFCRKSNVALNEYDKKLSEMHEELEQLRYHKKLLDCDLYDFLHI